MLKLLNRNDVMRRLYIEYLKTRRESRETTSTQMDLVGAFRSMLLKPGLSAESNPWTAKRRFEKFRAAYRKLIAARAART